MADEQVIQILQGLARTLEAQQVHSIERFDALQGRFDALHGRFDELRDEVRTGLGALTARVQALEDRVEARFLALENRVASVEWKQDQLQEQVIQVRTQVMDRIDRLQDALTRQQEGEIVTFASAHRAEKIARETREQVASDMRSFADQLSGMMRQINRLQTDVRQLRGEA